MGDLTKRFIAFQVEERLSPSLFRHGNIFCHLKAIHKFLLSVGAKFFHFHFGYFDSNLT